jgi:hypothetical protein
VAIKSTRGITAIKFGFVLFLSTRFAKTTQKSKRMVRRRVVVHPPAIAAALARFNSYVVLHRLGKRKDCNRREYIKYCTWVEDNNLRLATSADKFLHREALDQYARDVIVGRNGDTNAVGKIISSLQWCWDFVEELPDDVHLVIQNAVVLRARRDQGISWKIRKHRVNAGSDPHNGLKDLMTVEDRLTIMRYIHKYVKKWGSLSVSNSWGNMAAVRGATNRASLYSDLNLGNYGEKIDPRVLMLVIRKGEVNKDNHLTDKQVGVMKNKDFLLCASFNTALHVINDLANDNTINFLHVDKAQRAPWWDKKLIDMTECSEEGAAMEAVYTATGVKSCKVTHHRTQAIQLAGSESLAPWQINTMTKHMLEKLPAAYQSETDRDTMRVMAGYPKGEYFNENSLIQLPHEVDHYVQLLLPKYCDWLRQRESPNGDKSQCCETFLLRVLPYLVETLVQCGVFFIEEFPLHSMSRYLTVSLVLSK